MYVQWLFLKFSSFLIEMELYFLYLYLNKDYFVMCTILIFYRQYLGLFCFNVLFLLKIAKERFQYVEVHLEKQREGRSI